MASSIGFRILSCLPSCYSSYGAWTLTPVGLAPTDHASLRWTHTSHYRSLLGEDSAPLASVPQSLGQSFLECSHDLPMRMLRNDVICARIFARRKLRFRGLDLMQFHRAQKFRAKFFGRAFAILPELVV